MIEKDPFTYPLITYIWVLGLAVVGGIVGHLNRMRKFRLGAFLIDIISSGFIGLLTFWLCEASDFSQYMTAALVGISGHMGSRAWFELENALRSKLGLPLSNEDPRNGLDTNGARNEE